MLIPLDKNKKKERKKERYQIKEGFVRMDVLRGLHEIKEFLHDLRDRDCFVCGGYVRYMCSTNKKPVLPGDIDVYSMNEKAYEDLKAFFEKERELPINRENDMAVTFQKPKDVSHPYFATPGIQLIKPVIDGRIVAVGSRDVVIENFDFSVVRIGLYPTEEKALADANFPYDEENKLLRLRNIHCPVSSTYRCIKYIKKGYWLKPLECLKLFLDWDQRDESYRSKLIEFLNKADAEDGLTEEEINELEAMMRID